MSSSTDSSFWNEQAREMRPGNASSSSARTSSAVSASQFRSRKALRAGRCGRLATDQHLLERVGAEPEAERLERDHLVGRDVPEVHVGAELLDEPGLARL